MDVTRAVQDFFMGHHIPKGVSNTLIVLIPKNDNPSSYSEFRPICLSTFISKICTKVMVTRLKSVLPKIISKQHAGFMANRDIADQVLIAQELMHNIDKKVRGSNFVVKLDMSKTFDKVSWHFLSLMLLKFGFCHQFVQLIMNHLQATFLSVLVNGSPQGFFKPFRGVKQGDPLSPFLFIIASEAFSRGLHWMMQEGRIQPFWMGGNGITISHLGFAYDLLVFLNGESRSLLNFKAFLSSYEGASDQEINLDKSSILRGKAASYRKARIKNLLGMKLTDLPVKYLGVNLHKRINRFQFCGNLIKQFENKLTPWKQKNLTHGGRLILIKHVLSSLPLHILAVDLLPKKVINVLNRKLASFFLGSNNDRKKAHWITWAKLCYPTVEGGLGIRSLTDLEKAFILKLWWKWKTGDSLWARFIQARYNRNENMIPKVADSPVWRRICCVHEMASSLISTDAGGIVTWNEEENGQFTFKSAFEEVRDLSFSSIIYQQIWDSQLELKMKIFQWKIVKGIVPIIDKLQRFNKILSPSMCPM
ncbi:unnamed protein product [Cuscuta europaea]|uniref:Reverse transcriptase domain-containing protein n=1 Tax=Cuscuta europaea TaxID=41803 RepID=A0A9P1E5G6_CUSEU|nr:unnamed protein product [Cuscuta europaea]